MAEWQPIETAPKDGTPILIWDQEGYGLRGPIMFVAAWGEKMTAAPAENEWVSVACVDDWLTAERATHWMPLPAPPEKEADADRRYDTISILISMLEDLPDPTKGQWHEYTGQLVLSEDQANALYDVHKRFSEFEATTEEDQK